MLLPMLWVLGVLLYQPQLHLILVLLLAVQAVVPPALAKKEAKLPAAVGTVVPALQAALAKMATKLSPPI